MSEEHTPASNPSLLGHLPAEEMLLRYWEKQNLPHAMLMTGPKGIGKATLAYRLARFILNNGQGSDMGMFGPQSLAIAEDAPVFQRVAHGSHSDLLVIQPQYDAKKKAFKSDILVGDTRKIGDFLSKTSSEGIARIIIIDSVDQMNVSAANSILKILEEPPKNAYLFLISHNPGTLLPTIRSRCRQLKLAPPTREIFVDIVREYAPNADTFEMEQLYAFSNGAPGQALYMLEHDALNLYQQQLTLASHVQPHLSKRDVTRFAQSVASKQHPEHWDVWQLCWQRFMTRLGQYCAGITPIASHEDETSCFSTLAASQPLRYWLELYDAAREIIQRTDRLHLDKEQTVTRIMHALEGQGLRS